MLILNLTRSPNRNWEIIYHFSSMKLPTIFEALTNLNVFDMEKFHHLNNPNSKNFEDSFQPGSLFSSTPARTPMGSVSSAERIIMPATREIVDQLVASDAVVIFSKTYCPYCKMAKEVFDKLKKKYTAIELDQREDADDIQNVLGEMTGARTVPRVFVKGECLGGGTDVKKLYESGELEKKF